MNIYNTSHKKLVLPEYGRNIQKMVDHLKTIENREMRNKAAREVISIMGNLNPQLRDIVDFKHKLWDHLALMSNFELDIDSPYPSPLKSQLFAKPKKVLYNQGGIQFKHYGKMILKMIKIAVEMKNDEKKKFLIELIATQMKKAYLTWNKEVVEDYVIFEDIRILSEGKIEIDKNLHLSQSRDLMAKKKKQ